MPVDKKYLIEIPGQQGTAYWGEERYNANKDALMKDHPDAIVFEVGPYSAEDALENDMFSISIPKQEGTALWDSKRFNANSADLLKDHPDAQIKRVRPVDYWEEQRSDLKRQLMEHEAQYGAFLSDYESKKEMERSRGLMNETMRNTPESEYILENAREYAVRNKEREALRKAIHDNPREKEEAERLYNSINELATNIEGESNQRYKEALQQYTAEGGRIDPNGDYETTVRYKADSDQYEIASRMLKDAKKTLEAPSKYDESNGFVNFLKGAGHTLGSEDFWTMGMSTIMDNLGARQAFEKIWDKFKSVDINELAPEQIDEMLTPGEKALVEAFTKKAQADASRAYDLSLGYQAGMSSAESLGFMAQFALTGGITSAATKAATKGAARWLAKGFGNMAAKGVSKGMISALKMGGKFALGTTRSLIDAAVRTGVTTTAAKSISEQLLPNISEGTLPDANIAVLKGLGDAFIENWSEAYGSVLGSVFNAPFKAIFPEWSKAIAKTPMMQFAEKAGFNGYLTEIGEEWFGNAMRAVTKVDPEALKNFATVDNQIVTMTAFLPMTLIGGGVSLGQVKAAEKSLENKTADLRYALEKAGLNMDEIDALVDYRQPLSPQMLSDRFTPLITRIANTSGNNQLAAEVFKSAGAFSQAVARYQAMNGGYQAEQQNANTALRDEMVEKMGGSRFWNTRESEVKNENGEAYTFDEVQVVTGVDGSRFFIVGQAGDQLATIDEDGKTGVITQQELEAGMESGLFTSDRTMMLDQFLSEDNIVRRRELEKQRMSEERAVQVHDLRAKYPAGSVINLGTRVNPINGVVAQHTANGVVVQTEDKANPFINVPYEQFAQAVNTPIRTLTDEQIASEEAALIEAKEAEKETELADTPEDMDAAEETAHSAAELEQDAAPSNIPLNEDGTVNEQKFLEESPEEYVAWNDNNRQDGGADSREQLEMLIPVYNKMYNEAAKDWAANAADPVARRAAKESMAEWKDKIDRVNALLLQYNAPAHTEQNLAERTVQAELEDLHDGTLSAEEITANIDAHIAEAQNAYDEYAKNAPQMGTDRNAYRQAKAEFEEGLKALEQELNYWNEVKAANENYGKVLSGNEIAQMEERRLQAIKDRVGELEKTLGVGINVIERAEDVTNQEAKREIESGYPPMGWFNVNTGKVDVYLPAIPSAQVVEETVMHEIVGHKGLRGLLGDKQFNRLCESVYGYMEKNLSAEELYKYLHYPGVNGDRIKAADEYMAYIAENVDFKENMSVWEKIISWVKDALRAIGLGGHMTESDIVDLLKRSYERLITQDTIMPNPDVDTVTDMTDAAQQDESAVDLAPEDGTMFSIKTENYLADQIRGYAKSREGKKAGWTKETLEEVIAETESLITAIHNSSTGNEFYDEFASKDPTIRMDWRDGQLKPIVTWTRANIEYKYDMSADLLCVNNEGLEEVLSSEQMVALMPLFNMSKKDEVTIMDMQGKEKTQKVEIGFSQDDYLELYSTLKDLGFVVPCKGCFDAAGRFKMLPSVAYKFAAAVNAVIDERNADPEAFDAALKAKAGKSATVEGLPTAAKTKLDAIRAGVAGDNLTKHVKWTQLMSADGQTKMLSDWGGIFRAWQRTGAGRPKDKLLPEPYYGDIVSQQTTIIGKYGEKTPSFKDILVNTGTGLRRNSHSEFRPVLAVDEIQFMRDAFIKNLTVFKYMKELDDVRLFGQLGVKFNMSFFPEFVEGTKAAGLDLNGDYIPSEESVGAREFPYIGEDGKKHYDGRKGWEEAQKHINKDVSLSSVILSIPHLIKALTDVPTTFDKSGIWGSLIPFHSSGATSLALFLQGLGRARANGVGHGFEEAFTRYGEGVTNFEAVQNDRFGAGWVIVEGKKEKVGSEVEEGHKLEFVNGKHYYNRAMGLHLFASTYVFDNELPEGALNEDGTLNLSAKELKKIGHAYEIDYNNKVREIGTPTAYEEAANYYLEFLPTLGLKPRFDFEVPEEIFLQMCEDANVDPTHPKLGWKGAGNAWNPIHSAAYYSLFCDYGMTDPATGEWAPHNPVGYVNENGEREFRMPENTVEIVKEGLDRYSEIRRGESVKINDAIKEFARRSVEKGRISQEAVDSVLGEQTTMFKTSNRNQYIFVSNAAKAVEGINMGKAAPEQWLKTLEKNGGLKAGEDKWIGLSEWLKTTDKKSITKQELLDFINENAIKIEEVHYGENALTRETLWNTIEETEEGRKAIDEQLEQDAKEFADEMMRGSSKSGEAKAKRHEELVREYLDEDFLGTNRSEAKRKVVDAQIRNAGVKEIERTRLKYTTEGLDNKHEIALTVPTIEPWKKSDKNTIHFEDAGEGRAVAWIRFGDAKKWVKEEREDGKKGTTKKILVIDEIQSARHEAAREDKKDGKVDENGKKEKVGYRDDAKIAEISEQIKNLETEREQIAKDILHRKGYIFHDEEGGEFSEREEYAALYGRTGSNEQIARQKEIEGELFNLNHTLREMRKAIPTAPFEKNWHELAMKRMLRYAAENGYDVVAWVNGDQVTERFGLGGVVDDIYYSGTFPITWDSDEKVRYIDINLKNGIIYHLGVDENGNIKQEYNGDGATLREEYRSFKDKSLADVVGKEVALQIMQMEEQSTLKAEDIKVGGKGMKTFYDQMLPTFMDKYGKKWGVKTEDIKLSGLDNQESITMHSVPVTEEMKESVMEGQTMFKTSSKPVTYDNFYKETAGVWEIINPSEAPNRAADYESTRFGEPEKVSSRYWYGSDENGDYVIRESDHWSATLHGEASIEYFKANPMSGRYTPISSARWAIDMRPATEEGTYNKVKPEFFKEGKAYGKIYLADLERMGQTMFKTRRPDQSAMSFTLESMRDYVQKYGNVTYIEVMPVNEDTARELGFTLEQLEKLGGVYRGKKGIAILAREKNTDSDQIETTIYHESVHHLNRVYPELNKLAEYLWNEADNIGVLGKIKKNILAKLEGDDAALQGELLAYAMEYYAGKGEIEDFIAMVPDEDAKRQIEFITNKTKYGRSEEVREDSERGEAGRDTDGQTREQGEGSGNAEGENGEETLFKTAITPEVRKEMDVIAAQAMVNGNYLLAPNGKETNLTPEQWALVRTKNFKQWFGDWENDPENASKVVDENGEPMVVYHGGDFAIDDFVPEGAMHFGTKKAALQRILDVQWGNDNWEIVSNEDGSFSWKITDPWGDEEDDRRSARTFSSVVETMEDAVTDMDELFVVTPVFLRISNPKTTADVDNKWSEEIQLAQENGYDGIVYVNEFEDKGSDSYIAFSPNQIKSATENNGEYSEENEDIRFKVRTKPAPVKTKEVYKLMRLGKDGLLYPLFIGGAEAIILKKWYDADSPNLGDLTKLATGIHLVNNETGEAMTFEEFKKEHPEMKLKKKAKKPNPDAINWATENGMRWVLIEDKGKKQKRYGGETRSYYNLGINGAGGVGKFAMRPGWHAGSLPSMRQIGKGANKDLRDDSFVWVRGRVPADVDYQAEADANPDKDIPTHIPTDGYYMKATNANKKTSQADRIGWYVAGSFIADEIISDAEARRVIDEWNKEHPKKKVEYDFPRESGREFDPARGGLVESDTMFKTRRPTAEIVDEGLVLPVEGFTDLAADIFKVLPDDMRKEILDNASNDDWDLKKATFQKIASLARKSNLSDSEIEAAKKIADKVQEAIGEDMTRPLTVNEALWMLYRATVPYSEKDPLSMAERAVVADNLGFSPKAKEEEAKDESEVRFKKYIVDQSVSAAEAYTQAISYWGNRMNEAFVDQYDAVDHMIKAIENATGKKAESWEDIRLLLTQSASKGLAKLQQVEMELIQKMWDAVNEFAKAGVPEERLARYVILKHGLERNEAFAKRDARRSYEEDYRDEVKRIKNDAALSDAEKQQKMDDAKDALDNHLQDIDAQTDARYLENRKRDYSGVLAMFADYPGLMSADNYSTEEEYRTARRKSRVLKYKKLADAEAEAQMEIDAFEDNRDALVKNLWDSINRLTKGTLKMQYDYGMLSTDSYLTLSGMFEYYVPLRGFSDNTGEDLYDYYSHNVSDGYAPPIMAAKGRRSEAESPFGWMAAMAATAVVSGEKNLAKQALYYFTMNRKANDLLKIADVWYTQSPADPDMYLPAYPPQADPSKTPAENAQQYADWEKQMESLANQGLAVKKTNRLDVADVAFFGKKDAPEHVIKVNINGEEKQLIVNANPRAAQAINGLLNIESNPDYQKVLGKVLRWMSQMSTGWNPEFWMTNIARDTITAFSAVNIKEDKIYRETFTKNWIEAWKLVKMLPKLKDGTLGTGRLEDLLREAVENGVQTGYSHIKSMEEWDKDMEKYLKELNKDEWKVVRAVKGFVDGVQTFSEAMELVSRFATYITSRELGRDVTRSVSDAKEVTVNFNRKGSGMKITLDEAKKLKWADGTPIFSEKWKGLQRVKGRASVAYVSGMSALAPFGRKYMMFFNAGVQGLNMWLQMYRKGFGKSVNLLAGTAFALGILNSVLQGLLDGDDDDYQQSISDYERRSNLMLGANGYYLKFALPQEIKAFYGLGDILYNYAAGNYHHKDTPVEIFRTMATQLVEILPINPMGGWQEWIPSMGRAVVEAGVAVPFFGEVIKGTNENFAGSPLREEKKWLSDAERESLPKYTFATDNTWSWLVGLAELANRATGGSEYDAGWLQMDPARIQHYIEQATGGLGGFAGKIVSTVNAAIDKEQEVTVTNIPFINKVFTVADERGNNKLINEQFYYYKGVADAAEMRYDKYLRSKDSEKRREERRSDEYKIMKTFLKYEAREESYRERLKRAKSKEEEEKLKMKRDANRKRFLDELAEKGLL